MKVDKKVWGVRQRIGRGSAEDRQRISRGSAEMERSMVSERGELIEEASGRWWEREKAGR